MLSFSFVFFYEAVESAAKFDFCIFGHCKVGKIMYPGEEKHIFHITS